jgi:uncharacterized protein (TIGR01777 family)
MRIAVSGASGFLGQALAPRLESDGHEVVRLVRRLPERAHEVEWDPARGSIDRASLTGIDAIVNLSGATIGKRWTTRRKQEILDSRVQTTRLLAETAAGLEPRPSVLVNSGGVGIYGDRGDEILTEESQAGSGFLADVSRAWEAASAPAEDAGIRVVRFRQGVVLGPGGGVLAPMLTPFRLGLGGRVGSGKQWWSWVALADLVSAYVFALSSPLSGAVNVSSPEPVTNARFVKALGRAVHRPTVFPLPEIAVRSLFGEMGEEVLLAGQRALPAKLVDAGFQFAYAELDAALAEALRD